MSLAHNSNLRNALANLVVQAVDAGAAHSSGRLVIFDASNNVISTMTMQNPSFAAAVLGSCIANALTNDPAPVAGGIPARFEVQDRDGNWVFRGSCAPTGDLGAPSGPILGSQLGSCSGLAYNAPP